MFYNPPWSPFWFSLSPFFSLGMYILSISRCVCGFLCHRSQFALSGREHQVSSELSKDTQSSLSDCRDDRPHKINTDLQM